ncbi:hypothetical protein BCR43DRAFT_513940 [Syncephalastrum racemosum]|uniref:Uncharacterized protein n=1 Tax=Syncephalastrum racemosum TaxID=13706 RepID=A0A1X2HF50_SYNRA|nr:hypothetical protein BCR43DRAFT_513940 [Syncephalastrum racemosum]
MSLTRTLSAIRGLFEQDGVRDNLWYILTATVMASLNHPEDIPHLYTMVEQSIDAQAVKQTEKDQQKVQAVLRLRDGILKSFIASGFPKVINALQHLESATPDSIKAKLPTTPVRHEESWQEIVDHRKRGTALFGKIYERHTQRVLDQMHRYYPDLKQTALYHLYGPVLSETSILSGKESSLILVTGLKAQDVAAQLRGHGYGALHQGATRQDLDRIDTMVNMLFHHYNLTPPKAKL